MIAQEIKELIVEQEEKERLERGAEEELNRQCGDGTVQKVEVLQYGDEPVIEPGQAMVRVILTPTGEDPDETLHAFEKAHSGAIEDLRKKIAQKMPFIRRVQFTLPAQPGERKHPVISMSIGPLDRMAPGRNLTAGMSHYRLCTPEAVQDLGVIDAHVRRRIRAIIVRQKKRQRFLFRHLRAKGVSVKAAAGCAYCGKGAWVKSNRPAMTRAYPPSWFDGRMRSLKAVWQGLHLPPVSAQLLLGF